MGDPLYNGYNDADTLCQEVLGAPDPDVDEQITIGAASAKNTTDLVVGRVYSFMSTTDCYVKFGPKASVSANTGQNYYLPAYVEKVWLVRTTGVAAIQVAAAGTLFINLMDGGAHA